MTKRMATMLIATAALGLAACSSGSKGGGTVTLPSISADSPTASPTASVGESSSPSSEPASSASSSPSASVSPSASASSSASASASPTALAGGACPSSHLSVSLGAGQGAAGSQISPLVFTNTGPAPCTLSGYPGVSFVTGNKGSQVGAPAMRSGGAGSPVILAANGTAQALVKVANTENYPAATCSPVTVLDLLVYPPGQTAALFVALPDGTTACSSTSVKQLSVQTVAAG